MKQIVVLVYLSNHPISQTVNNFADYIEGYHDKFKTTFAIYYIYIQIL